MLFTPKKTIETIIRSGNHYVAQVKGNQKTLLEEVHRAIKEQTLISDYELTEKGHGRISKWHVSVYDASKSCKTAVWKNLSKFIRVQRQTTEKGKPSNQETFFISDLTMSAAEFHKGIRGHWGIENRLHWVKDVIYKEDANRIYKKNAPVNVAVLSTISINIHRKNGNPSISYGQIKFGGNVKELFTFIRT